MRQITSTYFVSPQLDPSEFPAIAAAGVTTIIDNRPDAEIPPSHQSDAMRKAAEDAGLKFVEMPLTHQTFTPDRIAAQRDAIEQSDGPCLAYCASGTRSTIAWALGQAGRMPTDDIIAAAASAGYDLENIRPTLEAAARAQME